MSGKTATAKARYAADRKGVRGVLFLVRRQAKHYRQLARKADFEDDEIRYAGAADALLGLAQAIMKHHLPAAIDARRQTEGRG